MERDWKMKNWTKDRSNNVHTQRTPLRHRATLHRTTRITLASFESSWRDQQDLHNFAPLRIQNSATFRQTCSPFCSFIFKMLNKYWKEKEKERRKKTYINSSHPSKVRFKRSFTAKHLTMFGLFGVHLSTRRAEKKQMLLIFFDYGPKFTYFDEHFSEFRQFVRKRSTSPRFSNFLGFPNEYFWNFQETIFETLEKH